MSPEHNSSNVVSLPSASDNGTQNFAIRFPVPSKPQPVTQPSSHRARQEAICAAGLDVCRKHFKSSLQAVVLTGSLARDEASFLDAGDGRISVLGDAEFPLFFHRDAPLPTRKHLDDLQHEIEMQLRSSNLVCSIGLTAGYASYLRNLRPHIYAYELRNCGRVIWGQRVLSLIPEFAPADIPVEDGWRLLCNRMIEHLGVADSVFHSSEPLPLDAVYSVVKLSLDMATSFLLFCGLYAPTYQRRCERLRTLAKSGGVEFAPPFSLGEFAELVEWATQCKLAPNSTLVSANRDVWRKAVTFATALWQWELARLSGVKPVVPANSHALMRRWMRKQSFYDRARGWASLLRLSGWSNNISLWPRWALRAWWASPRNWIYAATGELFLVLPHLAEGNRNGTSIVPLRAGEIRSWLPLRRPSERKEFGTRNNGSGPTPLDEWRDLASDVLWTYSHFLRETRS